MTTRRLCVGIASITLFLLTAVGCSPFMPAGSDRGAGPGPASGSGPGSDSGSAAGGASPGPASGSGPGSA